MGRAGSFLCISRRGDAADSCRKCARRHALKHGSESDRSPFDADSIAAPESPPEVLALDESLTRLEAHDPVAAQFVTLRYFTGLSVADAAQVLGISPHTADRMWVYAKAWLYRDLEGSVACRWLRAEVLLPEDTGSQSAESEKISGVGRRWISHSVL